MNNTPKKLFDLLVSRDYDPQVLDITGRPAQSPQDGEVFSFDYTGKSGKDYGTVVVLLSNENEFQVFFGNNLGKGMEQEDKNSWFDFLQQLRQFAKRNLLSFAVSDLNRLKYSMQGQAALSKGLMESWSGTRTTSFSDAPERARLMIKHNKTLGETDARYRYIQSMFIETAEGERYKLPFNRLGGGRAMLEHVRQGGKPYDVRGQHIVNLMTEMELLSKFIKASNSNLFEGDTATLVEQATEYYQTLRHNIKSMASGRGYTRYFESWEPSVITEEDIVIEDVRSLFVTQSVDPRIENALPILARIKQQENTMKEIGIFEGWVNCLAEGTWSLPDTPEKQQELVALMSEELPVGSDATNATEQLYDLLGDDVLFDSLIDLAKKDANADARPVIVARLKELADDPSVAQVIGKIEIEEKPEDEEVEDEENIDIDINKNGIDQDDYSYMDDEESEEQLNESFSHDMMRLRLFSGQKPYVAENVETLDEQGVAEGENWDDEYVNTGSPFPDREDDDLDTYGGEHDPDDLDESSGTEYRGFDIRTSREYGTGEVVYWIYYRGRCTEHGSRTLDGAKKDIDKMIAGGFFNDPDEEARKKQRGVAEGKETINIGDDVVIIGNSAYAGVTGRVIGFREGKIVVDMLEQGKVRFAPERVKLQTQGVAEEQLDEFAPHWAGEDEEPVDIQALVQDWINSEEAPLDDDAGNDNLMFDKAMRFLDGRIPLGQRDVVAEKLVDAYYNQGNLQEGNTLLSRICQLALLK